MKKMLFCIVAFFLMIGGVWVENTTLNAQAESDVSSLVDFTVEVETGRDIRVLQLTDTQIIDVAQSNRPNWAPDIWETGKMNTALFQCITQVVNGYQPDLIILTGDNIYGEFDDNGTSLTRLIAVMESFEIPWAPVFGNHDNETKRGVDWQCQQFENAEHCLFKQRELTGNGNYSIGLVQGGKLKRTFYMLDSNGCSHASAESLKNSHFSTSAGLGADQVAWFEESMQAIKAVSSETKFSMAYHIQNAEFTKAMSTYGYPGLNVNIDTATNKKESDFGYFGHIAGEAWDTNGSIFKKMKGLGVDSIFVGHEHTNSSSIVYEGVRFAYGLKTGTYDTINWLSSGSIANNLVSGIVQAGNPLPGTPLVGGTAINVSEKDGSITSNHIYYEEGKGIETEEGDKDYDVSVASDILLTTGLGRKSFSYYSTPVEGSTGSVYRVSNLSKFGSMAVHFVEEDITGKRVLVRLRIERYASTESPAFRVYKNEEGYDIGTATEEEYGRVAFTPTYNEWIEVDITDALEKVLAEGKGSFVLAYEANGSAPEVLIDGFFIEKIVGKEWEDTFYATLTVDGVPVLTPVPFTKGATVIESLPKPPEKAGCYGYWEEYTLANADFRLNAVYVEGVHFVTFLDGENEVAKVAFKGEKVFEEFPVPPIKEGYDVAWEEYTLEDSDITVRAVYTPHIYYATFIADEVEVEKISFTVETEGFILPDVPEKAGFTGEWQTCVLRAEDIDIYAVYTPIVEDESSGVGSSLEVTSFNSSKKKSGCGSVLGCLSGVAFACAFVAVRRKRR